VDSLRPSTVVLLHFLLQKRICYPGHRDSLLHIYLSRIHHPSTSPLSQQPGPQIFFIPPPTRPLLSSHPVSALPSRIDDRRRRTGTGHPHRRRRPPEETTLPHKVLPPLPPRSTPAASFPSSSTSTLAWISGRGARARGGVALWADGGVLRCSTAGSRGAPQRQRRRWQEKWSTARRGGVECGQARRVEHGCGCALRQRRSRGGPWRRAGGCGGGGRSSSPSPAPPS
jgi:hypothetical protein